MGVIKMTQSIKFARWSLGVGGFVLLMQTLFGLVAILGLGFDSIRDITTALCLTLAFPSYLVGLKSLRISTILLWLFFVAQWANACLLSRPPELGSPFDWPHGDTLFAAIILVQCGYWLASKTLGKEKPLQLSDVFNYRPK
jgi:hypothetical protein